MGSIYEFVKVERDSYRSDSVQIVVRSGTELTVLECAMQAPTRWTRISCYSLSQCYESASTCTWQQRRSGQSSLPCLRLYAKSPVSRSQHYGGIDAATPALKGCRGCIVDGAPRSVRQLRQLVRSTKSRTGRRT